MTAMTMTDMPVTQCRERLARAKVGRVAWCHDGRPQIRPVNFALVGEDIVLRTSPYSDLGRQVAERLVAFEVDGLDEPTESGWSVVVHAQATLVDDPDEVASLRREGPQPWAPGQRNLFVRLRPERIRGRRVGDGR